MTRDFSKQERDDERPYSRNSSSGRNGEERSPGPARPRLNRDMVDKAWENGARQNHPDYRARGTQGGQPPRNNWRRPQQPGQSSAYNGRNNTSGNSRAPYGNRPDNRRPGEHTPNRYQGSQPRSFESGMRRFDERQYNERRDYQPRFPNNETRPQPRGDAQYPNSRPPSRNYEPRRDDRQPRSFGRDDRQPRSFEPRQDDRQPRSFDRDDRQPRSFQRDDRQPRSFDRNNPPPRGYYRERRNELASGRPDARNSRWQSRPQRFAQRPGNYSQPTPPREQFEGDYEQFDGRALPSEPGKQREARQPDNRVTRRPHEGQPKDPQFIAEVNQQTDALIEHIVPVEPISDGVDGGTEIETSAKTKKAKARTRTATAKVRRKNGEAKHADTNPGTPHLRPSHRGFKWPEAQQPEQAAPEQPEQPADE